MSIDTKAAAVDPQEQADAEAVLRHAFHSEPLDPEIACRVQERAARVTEKIERVHGIIDDDTFHDLLHDNDEDT